MNDLCKQLNLLYDVVLEFICLDMPDSLSLWFYIVEEF